MATMLCNSKTAAVGAVAQRRCTLAPITARPLPLRLAPCRFQGEDRPTGSPVKTENKTPLAEKTSAEEGLKVSPLTPDFTRRREVFVGRLAMFGYFAACFWEWYFPDHPNIIQQIVGFGQSSGLPISPSLVGSAFVGLIAYNAISALSLSPAKDNQEDVAQRETAAEPVVFKVSDWGFTKFNEILHGRIAMIGFFGVLVQQFRLGGTGWASGPGPLAQFANLLGGTPADDTFYSGAAAVFGLWSVLAITLAYVTGKTGTQEDASIQ